MLVERWRMLLSDESGFTLPELLTSMAILLTIMTAFTGLLVSTSRAEVDMNNRFQAQTEARLGLTKLRREVHCAISAVGCRRPARVGRRSRSTRPVRPQAPARPSAGAQSRTGPAATASGAMSARACSGTGVKVADYLSAGNAFTYYAQSTASLAKLGVQLDVNLTPTKPERRFRLQDDLVLRNSTRT